MTTSISRICPAMRKQTPTGARWMIQVVTCNTMISITIIMISIMMNMIVVMIMAIVMIRCK